MLKLVSGFVIGAVVSISLPSVAKFVPPDHGGPSTPPLGTAPSRYHDLEKFCISSISQDIPPHRGEDRDKR